jgi:hypothetical protein
MYNYYFAYGANQNSKYLLNRYCNKEFLDYDIGIILGYKFKLCYSDKINSVISTIVPSKYDIVYGLIYKISNKMLSLFDIQEHVDKGVYSREYLTVLDFEGNAKKCHVYIAHDFESTKMSSNYYIYRDIILDAMNLLDYPEWYKSYIKKYFYSYEVK